jgi:large subunit ribosomal protein L10
LGVDEVPSKEKIEKVKEIKKWFDSADSLIVMHYVGLKVSEAAEVRAQVKGGGNELRVLKNTLTKIALDGTDKSVLNDVIDGPTAVVFVNEDLAGTARILREFSRGRSGIYFQGGMLGSRLLSAADVESISVLPPRDVLLAQLVGQVVGQLSGIVSIVAAAPRKMLSLMRALSDKLEKESPPPAEVPEVKVEEAPAEEAPAEEASAPEPEAPAPADVTPAEETETEEAKAGEAPAEAETVAEEVPAEPEAATEEAPAEPDETPDTDTEATE